MQAAQLAENRFARLGTEILAPWVWVLGLPLVVAWRVTDFHPGETLLWGSVVGVTGSLIPMAVIVRGARQGKWDSHHVTDRAGRVIPFAACIGSLAAGFVLLILGGAPYQMLALAAAMLASLVVSVAVTFGAELKVSMHAGVAVGAVIILALTYGTALVLLLLVLVAWVCWSRLSLRHHTPAEITGGLLIGLLTGGGGYWLLLELLA
ncbi:phosphatase PAP2 family protein [Amycolatopsis magusensis]|uniref:phosphatase PAP2 family protein n=1 Tax=Amycolatopsis magusensis TaxID=882444 RepID=UPI0024A8C98D|nr:phosphatase PAP2 family protein [Amycolatopsis magusensis]MDI5974830.1 phosphatase PAP2 family protein [Amycolatopsis magusensis]